VQLQNVRNRLSQDSRVSGWIDMEWAIPFQRAQMLKAAGIRKQETAPVRSAGAAGKPRGRNAGDSLDDAPGQGQRTKLTCRTNEDANGLLPAPMASSETRGLDAYGTATRPNWPLP